MHALSARNNNNKKNKKRANFFPTRSIVLHTPVALHAGYDPQRPRRRGREARRALEQRRTQPHRRPRPRGRGLLPGVRGRQQGLHLPGREGDDARVVEVRDHFALGRVAADGVVGVHAVRVQLVDGQGGRQVGEFGVEPAGQVAVQRITIILVGQILKCNFPTFTFRAKFFAIVFATLTTAFTHFLSNSISLNCNFC